MTPIVEFWQGRSPRERWLLASLLAVLLGVIWFVAAVGPLLDRADSYQQRADAEQALLEQVNRLGSRMEKLPAPRPRADTSLLLLANQSLRDAGLDGYLEEGSADGEKRVRLRLNDAPFPLVSAWLAGLAVREGIHTINADIQGTASPGLTQLSLVLERAN